MVVVSQIRGVLDELRSIERKLVAIGAEYEKASTQPGFNSDDWKTFGSARVSLDHVRLAIKKMNKALMSWEA